MQRYYFISASGQQVGPIQGEQLIACGVTPQTLVWGEFMEGWAPAGSVPELAQMFSENEQVAPDTTGEISNDNSNKQEEGSAGSSSENHDDSHKTLKIVLPIVGVLAIIGAIFLFTSKSNDNYSHTPNPEPKETTGYNNGHEWVDLGLPSGTKWATCNIGASSPEDYGDYFAWGETYTKTEYTDSNSDTYDRSETNLRNAGIIDSNGNLTKSYDVAYQRWGSGWRMPTQAEFEELLNTDYCTWRWTTQNGTNGYRVTGPNGNSIFLPAAGLRYESSLDDAGGCGDYWSSTVYDGSRNAYYLYFYSDNHVVYYRSRSYGLSVRPVTE